MSAKGESASDFLRHEAVPGELLADRLARGALTPDEALRYAIEIGSNLKAIHARGLVHGSLSPYAIAITPAGARILDAASPAGDQRLAPYRSPEQVRGEPPDRRSDIFAFGVLLYQMASGRLAFSGTGADLDEKILDAAPPALQSKLPQQAAVEGVIAACLEKDPTRRRQNIQNAVTELKLAGRTLPRIAAARESWARQAELRPIAQPPPPSAIAPTFGMPPRRGRSLRWLWIVLAVAALLAAAGWAAVVLLSPQASAPVFKFAVPPPERARFPATPAISPDGHYLAFSAVAPGGRRMLWLRPLDTLHATALAGTEDAFAPFWSPDSRFIGFFADRSLKTVRIPGGSPVTLCSTDDQPAGGAWNPEGTILFVPGTGRGFYTVPASGGMPKPLAAVELTGSDRAVAWPQFLPHSKRFLFFLLTDEEATTGIYAADLDAPGSRRLSQSEANAIYAESGKPDVGYLLFLHGGSLLAQRFHPGTLESEGAPMRIAEAIGAVRTLRLTPASASATGILVYEPVAMPSRQLLWFDRSGRQLSAVEEVGDYGAPRIAPDGVRAIVARETGDGDTSELWLVGRDGSSSPVTAAGKYADSPIWSPGASRVAYADRRPGHYMLAEVSLSGGNPIPLLETASPPYPADWSRDGRFILFDSIPNGTFSDVFALCLEERRVLPVLQTPYSEMHEALSRDGKWLAYQSDESGRFEVYVRRFEIGARRKTSSVRVSLSGGVSPRWRSDGAELYYLSSEGHLVAATVSGANSTFAVERQQTLFSTHSLPAMPNSYDAAPDGQAFLLNVPQEWSPAAPITVVSNWQSRMAGTP